MFAFEILSEPPGMWRVEGFRESNVQIAPVVSKALLASRSV